MSKQKTSTTSYKDFIAKAKADIPTDSKTASTNLVMLSMSLKDSNEIDNRDALEFISAIKDFHLISQQPLVPKLKEIIDNLVVRLLKEQKLKLNKWDFCHLISGLDSIGTVTPALKTDVEEFLNNDYKSLPISSKIHFLLHCRNIDAIDNEHLMRYLGEIIDYVIEHQELLNFNSTDANAAIDLITYVELVLKLDLTDFEDALEILGKHVGTPQKNDPSKLQESVLHELHKKLKPELEKSKEDEWSLLVSGLKQNRFKIGNYRVISEYPIKHRDITLRDCDIAIIDENNNLIAIIEVDGPSHFVVKDTINGKTTSRNKLYHALVGENFFTINYNSKEEKIAAVVNEISEIIRHEEELRNQDILPEAKSKSTTTTVTSSLADNALDDDKKEDLKTKDIAKKRLIIKSKAEIETEILKNFITLIKERPIRDVLHEIEGFLTNESVLEKIKSLKIEGILVLEYLLNKVEKEQNKQNLEDLYSIIEILHIYGFANQNEDLVKQNQRLQNIFVPPTKKTNVDPKILKSAARTLLEPRISIPRAIKKLQSLNLETYENLSDNSHYVDMVYFCCSDRSNEALYDILSSNKNAFTAALFKTIAIALNREDINTANRALDRIYSIESKDDALIKAINAKDQNLLFEALIHNKHELAIKIIELFKTALKRKDLANAINRKNKDGDTALIAAGHFGQTEVVKIILNAFIESGLRGKKFVEAVNHQNEKGYTTLYAATYNGHEDIVRIVIDSFTKADVTGKDLVYAINHKNKNNLTILRTAAQLNHIEIVKIILDKFVAAIIKKKLVEAVNQQDDRGTIALHTAALGGHEGVVKTIIESFKKAGVTGKDLVDAINYKNKNNVTTLITAAQQGHTEIVQIILNAFIDSGLTKEEFVKEVNKEDKNGLIALIIAAQIGHEDIVRIIIDSFKKVGLSGKDLVYAINRQNKSDDTALTIANEKDQTEVVKIILDEFTAACITKEESEKEVQEDQKLTKEEFVKEVNKENRKGATALIFAVCNKDHSNAIQIIESFKTVGLSGKNLVYAINHKKITTALRVASHLGREEVVKIILDEFIAACVTKEVPEDQKLTKEEFAKEVNKEDAKHTTALMIAAHKYKDIVIKIIESFKKVGLTGRDLVDAVNYKNKNNVTTLITAAQQGNTEVVEEILNEFIDCDLTGQEFAKEVNQEDNVGYTTLLIAALKGHKDTVIKIIESFKKVGLIGKDLVDAINHKNKDGGTPLMAAATRDNAEVVEEILNALKEILNAFIDSILEGQEFIKQEFIKQEFVKQEFVKEVHQEDKLGYTTLILAALKGHKNTVIKIIESFKNAGLSGKDLVDAINHQNITGETALMSAAITGSTEVVEVILNAFIDSGLKGKEFAKAVNIKDEKECTALFYATKAGHKDTVTKFIESFKKAGLEGDDFKETLNHTNEQNKTALEIAKEHNKTETVKILENALGIRVVSGSPLAAQTQTTAQHVA